jgi:RNA polymerase sigma-70 factor (ECF subfamily)
MAGGGDEMSALHPWPAELDEATLRRAQGGDDSACRALIERYQRPVFALLHRMMGPAQVDRVEELAHETFLRLLHSLAGFAPLGPARLSKWILTIAARRALDEQPSAHAVPAEGDAHPPVARVTAALPARDRAALLLRAYHGFEVADVARALACQPDAVESSLQRAHAALLRLVGAVEATSENELPSSEPLTQAELAALATWTAPAPPPGFADRLLAGPRPAPAPPGAAPATMQAHRAPGLAQRRGRLLPWSIVAAAALLALFLVQLRSPPASSRHEAGSATPMERRSIRLGQRGVAVLEPGSSLSWAIEPGRARVTQRAGDVFYRTEPGGTIDVETPHGTIRATAACFRIDLAPGTSIAASAIVTVHEGTASLAPRDRPPRPIEAGHIAVIGAHGIRTLDRRHPPATLPD